jgi:alpha-tubulin suppressor-like RCC1 family protein
MFFSCARTSGTTGKCWGRNTFGQLGDGNSNHVNVATAVTGATTAGRIATGPVHSCSTNPANTSLSCWGYGYSGQLGNNSSGTSNLNFAAVPVLNVGLTPYSGTSITALATGGDSTGFYYGHSCMIDNGTVRCWGYNSNGQLGDGTTSQRATVPSTGLLGTSATDVAAGDYFTCAIGSGGLVYCWGLNASGQLGDGTVVDKLTPTSTGLSPAINISAGARHACAIDSANNLSCWGDNTSGQIGTGVTGGSFNTPQAVGSGYAKVVAGKNHTCALTTAGAVKCWGANPMGQLGDGTTTGTNAPGATPIASGALDISVGWDHSCARTSTGIQCWGRGLMGQLAGALSRVFSLSPALADATTTYNTLVSGANQTCVRGTGNLMFCWGDNENGAVGSTNKDTVSPSTGIAL